MLLADVVVGMALHDIAWAQVHQDRFEAKRGRPKQTTKEEVERPKRKLIKLDTQQRDFGDDQASR